MEGIHDAKTPQTVRRRIQEEVGRTRSGRTLAGRFGWAVRADGAGNPELVAQADRDEGHRQDGLTTGERDELQRLRRENERLREEREILKKAAAWFAQETKAAPNGSSNS